MLLKLAEQVYGKEGIFSSVFGGQFTTPIRDLDRPEQTTILVPELLETKTAPRFSCGVPASSCWFVGIRGYRLCI